MKVAYMEGQPCAQVIDHDDFGDLIVEHPLLPGLGPITLQGHLWEFSCRGDDPKLFIGEGI